MPTFPQHPDAADYTSEPWTDANGSKWLSKLVGTGVYRWTPYTAPVTGGGVATFAELTDKVTAPIATANTSISDALALLAPKASPTFTGTVTIPSGASISGYLTAATAALTYQPIGSYAPASGINLTSAVTGILPKANGGTGVSALGTTGESLMQSTTTANAWERIGGTGTAASPTFTAISCPAISSASGDVVVTPAGNQFSLATGKRFTLGTGGGMPMMVESSGTLRIRNVSNNAFFPISCGAITSDSTLAVTGASTLTGGVILPTSTTPASATAAGVAGTICRDADFIYVCTATNTWKRVAISTW